jgi:hypothetical protein
MIIQNKNDGHQEIVTPEYWEKIKELGFQKDWMVISNEAVTAPKKTMPKELIDFNTVIKNKKNGSKGSNIVPGDKDVQLDGDGSEGKTV